MIRNLLFVAVLAGCTTSGGLHFSSSSSGSSPSSGSSSSGSSSPDSSASSSNGSWSDDGDGDDSEADNPKALVAAPHSSGEKLAGMLAKHDDPKLEKNFRSQDAENRWPYYRQMVAEPWATYKKTFGIDARARATIDGDSFQADWYQQLKKDANATLTGPDYWCAKTFNASAINLDVSYALQQSKACMAAIKSNIKAYKCVDNPKQKELVTMELSSDGTLVATFSDPHVADSSNDFSAVLKAYAQVLPGCRKIVEKTLDQ